MSEVREKLSAGVQDVGDELAEMHATSAGMKALCCMICSEGMEDCRKLLGGHGYLLNSGVAPGAVMTVRAPDGRLLQVQVPAGAVPGSTIQVAA